MDLSNTHFHEVECSSLRVLLARIWLFTRAKNLEKVMLNVARALISKGQYRTTGGLSDKSKGRGALTRQRLKTMNSMWGKNIVVYDV